MVTILNHVARQVHAAAGLAAISKSQIQWVRWAWARAFVALIAVLRAVPAPRWSDGTALWRATRESAAARQGGRWAFLEQPLTPCGPVREIRRLRCHAFFKPPPGPPAAAVGWTGSTAYPTQRPCSPPYSSVSHSRSPTRKPSRPCGLDLIDDVGRLFRWNVALYRPGAVTCRWLCRFSRYRAASPSWPSPSACNGSPCC